MNKQEVISKLESAIPKNNIDDYQKGAAAGLNFALLLLTELDESEKPVVPQFVADWLEVCKDNLALSLASSMNNIVMRTNNQPDKTIHWVAKNSETFAKAWIYGYEVEKEKRYTVELPNPNAGGHVVLCKTSDGIVSIAFAGMARWKGGKNFQLTESEIKRDFDWAWQFAKEVEQCNQER